VKGEREFKVFGTQTNRFIRQQNNKWRYIYIYNCNFKTTVSSPSPSFKRRVFFSGEDIHSLLTKKQVAWFLVWVGLKLEGN
jgi:hypothetical protein